MNAPDRSASPTNNYVTRPMAFAGVFDDAVCDRIVQLGLSRPGKAHSLDYGGPDSRRASSHWIARDAGSEWLFRRLHATFLKANQWYDFDLDEMRESLLFAHYPPGPGFTWHLDTLDGLSSRRKISMSIQLTEPAEYDGGDLEFIPDGVLQLSRVRGTLIAFPSVCAHRVTPITRGTRNSLVAWMHGPPFR